MDSKIGLNSGMQSDRKVSVHYLSNFFLLSALKVSSCTAYFLKPEDYNVGTAEENIWNKKKRHQLRNGLEKAAKIKHQPT